MSFVNGGVGRRGGCTSKRRFRTYAEAEEVLDRMVSHGAARQSREIKRCRYGKRDHFHIAHAMTKDRKGRRR